VQERFSRGKRIKTPFRWGPDFGQKGPGQVHKNGRDKEYSLKQKGKKATKLGTQSRRTDGLVVTERKNEKGDMGKVGKRLGGRPTRRKRGKARKGGRGGKKKRLAPRVELLNKRKRRKGNLYEFTGWNPINRLHKTRKGAEGKGKVHRAHENQRRITCGCNEALRAARGDA